MRKVTFIVIMVLLFNMVLVSCGETKNKTNLSGANNVTDEGKQITVNVGPDIATLDPALVTTIDCGNMLLHIDECLVVIDKDEKLIPGQAESWETSEDGLVWTFHLRDGLKWSDGSDLTAKDFEYSWKRIADPKTAAPYAQTVLFPVKGFEEAQNGDVDALGVIAKDEKTLEVTLSVPCPFFDKIAAFQPMSPVKKSAVEDNAEGWAINPETFVCNGAFVIDEWVPGSYIVTKKNPNYYNADAVKLESIKWLLIEEPDSAYAAYQAGEIDMTKEIPSENISFLKGNDDFYVEPIIGTIYLTINCDNSKLQDINIRKALSLAIDREYVANTILEGLYTPAYNYIGPGWSDPMGGDFIDKANNGEPYISTDFENNLKEAKELMKKAGYNADPNNPDFKIKYTTSKKYNSTIAEYLQQAWKEIGVEVTVETIETVSYMSKCASGDYEISSRGWVGENTEPCSLLNLAYSTNGNNISRYNDPEYDKQMDISRTTIDKKERSDAFHKAEDILMSDFVFIPIVYNKEPYLLSSKVKGAWHSIHGCWIFTYADVEE